MDSQVKFSQLRFKRITPRSLSRIKPGAQFAPEVGRMRAVLETGGEVMSYWHRGRMVGCYMFERVSRPPAVGVIPKAHRTRGKYVFQMVERRFLEEYRIFSEEADKVVCAEIREIAAYRSCAYIIWMSDNGAHQLKPSAAQSFSAMGYVLGLSLGFLYGIATGEFAVGVSMGCAFGLLFSTIFARK